MTTGLAVAVLCLLLVAHVTLSERPFAGWSFALAAMASALALFALWTLLSGDWSDSPVRALVESDRALLYLLMLVFVGLHARGPGRLAALLRWVALAIAVTSFVALLTRLLPATFPTKAGFNNQRLQFPLTYWNAVGVFTALGVVLATHFTASEREPAGVRIAAAAALPIVAVTLYFSFSRGGIAVAIAGTALYIILAHPRGLAGALAAVTVPLAVALHSAYGSELLAQNDYAGADARAQGRTLLVVVIACAIVAAVLRWQALRLDRRIIRARIGARTRTIMFSAVGITVLLALAVSIVAFDLPTGSTTSAAPSSRATRPRGGRPPLAPDRGRQQRPPRHLARRASRGGRGAVARRRGGHVPARVGARAAGAAGARRRRALALLRGAGRAGWIGIALLLVVFAVPIGVAISRLWGPGRHTHAAFLAAAAALLIHAMVDWDWEMPALFVWFFGAAGAVIAAPAVAAERAREPRRLTRVLAGLAILLVAVTPVTVTFSQSRLNRAEAALRDGDCTTATNSALGSLDALSSQAGAFEVLGWCDLRAGQQKLAITAMRNALRRDPDNWHYAYGLAVAQALAGEDPRPAAALASASIRSIRTGRARARGAAGERRAPPGSRGAARHPVRLTTRGGPEPASRRSVARALSARRRYGGGAPGRHSAARCRRGGPGWPRSR